MKRKITPKHDLTLILMGFIVEKPLTYGMLFSNYIPEFSDFSIFASHINKKSSETYNPIRYSSTFKLSLI